MPVRPANLVAPVAEWAETLLAERIRQRVVSRLGARIRQFDVVVKGDQIRLCGECSTYYSKQLAQHAALGVIEDELLSNEIEVTLLS
jgi:hypothetical protein